MRCINWNQIYSTITQSFILLCSSLILTFTILTILFQHSFIYLLFQTIRYVMDYIQSVREPVVARQISKRYSSSCHVFISMWGVISSTASMIRCLKSVRSRTFLLYTTSLINPHARKSNGIKSGDLGGQAVGPPLPTQRPGKVLSRNVVTSLPTLKYTDVHKKSFWVTLYTVENINCIKLLGTKT